MNASRQLHAIEDRWATIKGSDFALGVRNGAVRLVGRAGERVGLSVTPNHFYGAVASRGHLAQSETWRRPFLPAGLHWDLADQDKWLTDVMSLENRMTSADKGKLDELGRIGSGFGYVEEQVLFAFMRKYRPSRVIEIGSGRTTAIMRQAALDLSTKITAIDPYSSLPAALRCDVEVIQKPFQEQTGDIICQLGEGDLLFIDSSHAVKTGSEVHLLYLDLLPRLRPGVHVHVHDIYLPFVHHPAILQEDLWDWQETALLAALLSNSNKFSVDCALSALAHGSSESLDKSVPGYVARTTDDDGLFVDDEGHFPASLWMRSSESG